MPFLTRTPGPAVEKNKGTMLCWETRTAYTTRTVQYSSSRRKSRGEEGEEEEVRSFPPSVVIV